MDISWITLDLRLIVTALAQIVSSRTWIDITAQKLTWTRELRTVHSSEGRHDTERNIFIEIAQGLPFAEQEIPPLSALRSHDLVSRSSSEPLQCRTPSMLAHAVTLCVPLDQRRSHGPAFNL
jgi:hypothetical protein